MLIFNKMIKNKDNNISYGIANISIIENSEYSTIIIINLKITVIVCARVFTN